MKEWFNSVDGPWGYAVVIALMVIENIFPPIPSEVVMPAAGLRAKQGEMSLVGVIIAGSAGAIIGAVPWYLLGRWFGRESVLRWCRDHGRWLGADRDEAAGAIDWFDRWGAAAVLVGRLVPGVRTLISLPAGFTEMPLGTFFLFTTIGVVLWNALLAGAGYLLGDASGWFQSLLGWIGAVVVGGMLLVWLYRVLRPSAGGRRVAAGAGD
ncbi:DedA family protein [Botrimarina sp.]|uniref:DedA family protein n=1 Tax=Botrimarina sp. TaxID=2795802 RepID=UPI0032ED3DA6